MSIGQVSNRDERRKKLGKKVARWKQEREPAGTRQLDLIEGGARKTEAWTAAEIAKLIEILQGALATRFVDHTIMCTGSGGDDGSANKFHRLWDRRLRALESQGTVLTLFSLDQFIAIRRQSVREHAAAAAHQRSQFQDEEAGQRFEQFARESDADAAGLQRLRDKLDRLGIPTAARAAVDKWIPRATDQERAAAIAEDERVRAEWERVGDLAEKFAAAEAAAYGAPAP